MKNKGICIFLMGRQRAGKDTAADYLSAHYGFVKMPLAGPVYGIARDVFGMVEKERGLLIQIGVKMREIDPLVFPKALWRRLTGGITDPLPEGLRVVVSDARFVNEWHFFKERGGIAVRILAARAVRAARPGYHAEYEHDATETDLDGAPADFVLVNESTLEDYYKALDEMMSKILADRT